MRLVLPALISVLSFVGTMQAALVPVQSKYHKIQLPGRFDKPADPGPFPAVILLLGAPAIRSTRRIRTWSSMRSKARAVDGTPSHKYPPRGRVQASGGNWAAARGTDHERRPLGSRQKKEPKSEPARPTSLPMACHVQTPSNFSPFPWDAEFPEACPQWPAVRYEELQSRERPALRCYRLPSIQPDFW